MYSTDLCSCSRARRQGETSRPERHLYLFTDRLDQLLDIVGMYRQIANFTGVASENEQTNA